MTIERIFEMPRKWTFQMPKLRKWVEERLEGRILNMFGGMVIPDLPSDCPFYVHNDIQIGLVSSMAPQFHQTHLDACDLTQWGDFQPDKLGLFDTVIFDPPYSDFQAVKTYGIKKAQKVTHARDVVEYVLRPGGRVISLGFNSTGMSDSRGFQKEGILLVNCGGSHNDIIVMSERRVK